jgi:hypothetical protein
MSDGGPLFQQFLAAIPGTLYFAAIPGTRNSGQFQGHYT